MTKRGMVVVTIIAGLIGLLVMGLVSTLIDPRYGHTCTQAAGRVLLKGGNAFVLLAGHDGPLLVVSMTSAENDLAPVHTSSARAPDLSGVSPGAEVLVQGEGCRDGWFISRTVTGMSVAASTPHLLSALAGLVAAGLFLFLVRRRIVAG
jgi:hypothetical protein